MKQKQEKALTVDDCLTHAYLNLETGDEKLVVSILPSAKEAEAQKLLLDEGLAELLQ